MVRLKELSTARLNKKLAGYTLLGAAAFTLTGKAHASDITYVQVGQSFDSNTANTTYELNLSGGVTFPDLSISVSNSSPTSSSSTVFVSNGAQIITDSNGAAALTFGTMLDPLNTTTAGWGAGGKMVGNFNGDVSGDWPTDGSSAYLGFYYVGTDGDHAGWINISTAVNTSGSDASMTINGYAVDNTPNEAITAGEMPATSAVPEPSTLSLLAMGSAGLLEVRRRRQKHA